MPRAVNEPQLAARIFAEVDSWEERLSVYQPRSLINRLNRVGHRRDVHIDCDVFDLLLFCQTWSQITEGAFDITAGPLLTAWGFTRREGRIPNSEQLEAARAKVGMNLVKLDQRTGRVGFRQPGVQLNFGAIGKGYTLDAVGRLLTRLGIDSIMASAGSSSVLGLGGGPWNEGYTIAIGHPLFPERPLLSIPLRDAGLSTSGGRIQSFVHEGQRYNHIIDPRTGWPVRGSSQVTVVAPTAAHAEVLSTAGLILGVKVLGRLLETLPGSGALVVEDVASGTLPNFSLLGHTQGWLVADEFRPYLAQS